MLYRRLIFLYLFILFTGISAQNFSLNNLDELDDGSDIRSPALKHILLLVNNQNVIKRNSSLSIYNNDRELKQDDDQLPQRSMNSSRILLQDGYQPLSQQLLDSARRSSPTPLATSEECILDVQRYCSKGTKQMISNLKVLQCVDELDNVSFSK
jgi:hypothetical protein